MSKRKKPTAPIAAASATIWTPQLQQGAVVLLLVAVTCAVYFPSLGGGFLLDDDLLVTQNKLVQSPQGLQKIWFTTEPTDYWPVTNTSLWIEWRLWGAKAYGYRATNLILHITTVLLLWAVLKWLAIPGALLAALLFAVHPVNVESVAWIAQRKNLLAMLFFLLSIWWYLKREDFNRWYGLSICSFLLAMLSKGSVAILPLVLLLIAWWQRNRISKRDLLLAAPYFLIAAALTVVNIWFQSHDIDHPVRQADFVQRILGAAAVVWFYLWKALWPVKLAFIYPLWKIDVDDWRWWLPLVGAVAVTASLWWQRKSRWGRPVLFAWIFFCVALAPVMGFTDVGFMAWSLVADHYQHIALIGVVALVAAGLVHWFRQPHELASWAAAAAATISVGVLSWLTLQQSTLYGDTIALYKASIEQNHECWMLYNDLANALINTGRNEEAIEYLQQAVAIKPDFVEAHDDLGIALTNLGRNEEAISQFEQALNYKSNDAAAHANWGYLLAKMGQPQAAIEHYQKALVINPQLAEVEMNLGSAWNNVGSAASAIACFQRALELNPNLVGAHLFLGNALFKNGDVDAAAGQYQHALRLNPTYAEAHYNLASLLMVKNRFPEAISHYETAINLRPDNSQAYAGLGVALLNSNRPAEAVGRFTQAVELNPNDADAYFKMALANAQLQRSAESLAAAEHALNLARAQQATALAKQIESWIRANSQAALPGSK